MKTVVALIFLWLVSQTTMSQSSYYTGTTKEVKQTLCGEPTGPCNYAPPPDYRIWEP